MKRPKSSSIKKDTLAKLPIVLSLLLLAVSTYPSLNAQERRDYSPAELRQVMIDMLAGIEKATGIEPKASKAISGINPETADRIFDSIRDKAKFITSAREVMSKIGSAGVVPAMKLSSAAPAPFAEMLNASGNTGYTPAYPTEAEIAPLKLLGLVQNPGDRCDGDGFKIYSEVLYAAEETLIAAKAVCSSAACVPGTCVAVCPVVAVYELGVTAARIPLDLCNANDSAVDAAEIEAGYENGVTLLNSLGTQDDNLDRLLSDLQAHDVNIDGDLVGHDTRIKNQMSTHDTDIKALLTGHDTRIKSQLSTHDTDIKAMLVTILANQAEIIKLLKTPEGRRPGWGKDGY